MSQDELENVPFCKDCLYINGPDLPLPECMALQGRKYRNIVTGSDPLCIDMRTIGKCGLNGYWFKSWEEKE